MTQEEIEKVWQFWKKDLKAVIYHKFKSDDFNGWYEVALSELDTTDHNNEKIIAISDQAGYVLLEDCNYTDFKFYREVAL